MAEFYDGDTSYRHNPQGTRLAGANAPEMATPTGDEARDAAILAKYNAGMAPTGLIDTDKYEREVRQFADEDGNTLGQALVNTGMASPMSGKMALGVNPTSNAARELMGMQPQGVEQDAGFQFLAEQARTERLQFLDQAILSGVHGNNIGTSEIADPLEARGIADRAWDRGVDNMQGTFYGFADALGSLTGINALEKFGEDGVARNIWEAMASPATVESYEDIDSLADAGVYALEALVEFSPQLAGDVAAALGTGGAATATKYGLAGIGKALLRSAGGPGAVGGAKSLAADGLARSTFAKSAKGGAFASMYMQSAGETQNQLTIEGIDSPGTALAMGAAKAALDYAGLDTILRQVFKGASKSSMSPDSLRGLLSNAAKSASVAASAESLTEATQTLMDEMAIMSHKPEHEIEWTQVVDAMLKGGIAGGGVAGAGRLVTDTAKMVGESAGRTAAMPPADPEAEARAWAKYEAKNGNKAGAWDKFEARDAETWAKFNAATENPGGVIPAADAPLQPTAAEPLRDIEAQVQNAPQGEGNWYTKENAEQAKQVAATAGKAVKELDDGSVFVGTPELIESLPDAPTQADVAKFNGYAQTKDEAAADPQGTVVVESRTAEGAVLRNQLVGRSVADAVRQQQQQKYPQATVEVKEPEAVVSERQEAVKAERAAAKTVAPPATGKLAEQDVSVLIERATAAGVDASRFQQRPEEGKNSLGQALPARLEKALKAKVEGGGKRVDSVQSLAPVLDIPKAQLTRQYYDARNVIQGRDQLLQVVTGKVREQYGSMAAFGKAVDQLPLSQADAIRTELGLTEAGGYDIGRLVGEIESRESGQPVAGTVDLDSTDKQPVAPAAPAADRVRDAVFNTPAIRQILTRDGAVASGDQIDETLDGMGAKQRIQLEDMVKGMDIDVGGANRDQFLALLQESVSERAVYGIGKSRVDDEVSGDETTVQTVEFDPSALDSEDARLVQLVAATPLGDKAKNGWPAGLSLYLEAMTKILRAGEAQEQSALSDAEALNLNHARALAAVVGAAARSQPLVDSDALMAMVAGEFGVTPELIGKASGGKSQDVAASMKALSDRSDRRLGHALMTQLARVIDTDMDAAPGSMADKRRFDDLALLLSTGPEMAVKALADALRMITHGEPVEDIGLIAFYEQQDRDKPSNPASAKGRDAGRGDDVAVDEGIALGEQVMSDDSFFGAVRRFSIKAWDIAAKPTKAQLKIIDFRNPLSLEVTRRFEGENLLVLPAMDGSPFGSVVDAVALALYAQAGEKVPASPGEAASNLLENISRLMAGPQNSHDQFTDRAKAVVRTIPDDLIIFVHPQKVKDADGVFRARGVTFGEGLNHRHAFANANARQAQVQFELDKLTDDIGDMAKDLEAFATQLWADTAEVRRSHKVAQRAVDRWINMLAGEKDAKGKYYQKPTKEEDAPLRRAMDAIGRQKIGNDVMATVFSRYLTALGQRKTLSAESTALSQGMGAKRDAPSEEAIVASDRKLGEDYDNDPAGKRRVDQALRGGMGTAVLENDPDSIDSPNHRQAFDGMGEPEFNPYAQDPLHALSDEAWYDADDRAQEASIAAWLAAEGKPALFRLTSTVSAETLPKKGLAVTEVERIAREWMAGYNGNVQLDLRVKNTQEELYGPDATVKKHGVIKGAYQPVTRGVFAASVVSRGNRAGSDLRGKLGVVAAAHADPDDVVRTLRHEVLGHYGLNTLSPADKRAVLDAILASKNFPGLSAVWADVAVRYHDKDADVQAEEVFAYLAEQPDQAPKLWDRIVALVAKALRAVGIYKGTSRPELDAMIRQIGGAIRDGHAQQRNYPKTSDASFRRAVPSPAMLGAQGKQFWNKGVVPKLAPVFSMVYSRIERLHPQLAKALFQQAGSERSAVGRSWEQRSRALKGRMLAQVDRTLSDIRTGKRGVAATLAVQAAFTDAYSGKPKTADGVKVRKLVDQLAAEAKRAGLQSVDLGENFAAAAFDRQAVASRTAEFQAMLTDAVGIMPDEARDIISRIVDGPGVIEGAIAPGMPVGTHRTTKELMDAVGAEKLIAAGWMLPSHDAALFHWVDGVSKRASWEAIFGGEGQWTMRDGKVEKGFDPNAKFKAMLDQVRKDSGEQGAQEVLALVNGALGRHPAGQSMPGWWRSTQDFITGWVGMTVLAFSGIASIPELALPLIRANGRVGVGDMFRDYQDAKRFARDMGVVLSDSSEQVMWQTTGDQYRSPAINKMQSWFFRLNGNELIVKTSRTLATGIAIRYMLNAAADGDVASLQRLDLDPGTIHAWDQAGRPAWSPDLPAAEQALAARVTDAVNQFVNEATLNPSKFQSTHWGNNPYMKMIWHLKHFLYTYGDTVLGGMWREMRRRFGHLDPTKFADAVAIATPALIFSVAVLPLAAASLEGRDWIRRLNGQKPKEYEGAANYIGDVFSRAGGLGPVEFLLNMRQQQEWGASVFGSIAPTFSKVDMLFSDQDFSAKARLLTPIAAQNKALWPFD